MHVENLSSQRLTFLKYLMYSAHYNLLKVKDYYSKDMVGWLPVLVWVQVEPSPTNPF